MHWSEVSRRDELPLLIPPGVRTQESGKPHVVKRMERPRVRVIPEWFGGGALPRRELREAAEQLTADQAGLLVVSSEPVIDKAVDKALAVPARSSSTRWTPRSTRSPASCRKRSNAEPARRQIVPAAESWLGK